jgi:ribosome-associated protein
MESPLDSPPAVRITAGLAIPLDELSFRFSRAGGPGGQHVNKTETRVELLFDIAHSPTLSDWQRQRLLEELAGHIDAGGVLHLVASSERSQLRNRQEAIERFAALLAAALRPRRRRLPTQPSLASRERRLAYKGRRAEIKRQRRRVDDWS